MLRKLNIYIWWYLKLYCKYAYVQHIGSNLLIKLMASSAASSWGFFCSLSTSSWREHGGRGHLSDVEMFRPLHCLVLGFLLLLEHVVEGAWRSRTSFRCRNVSSRRMPSVTQQHRYWQSAMRSVWERYLTGGRGHLSDVEMFRRVEDAVCNNDFVLHLVTATQILTECYEVGLRTLPDWTLTKSE